MTIRIRTVELLVCYLLVQIAAFILDQYTYSISKTRLKTNV